MYVCTQICDFFNGQNGIDLNLSIMAKTSEPLSSVQRQNTRVQAWTFSDSAFSGILKFFAENRVESMYVLMCPWVC